ncbi:hypothetical protein J2R99_003473 [Rhodopseudomonas julia]|uniref:Uncharacterized protein n=1 Tax=Rhodopseudomonas julia TaxID=200617 RepID=A0ABU0CAV4_9BRAD|nr:hypothetical protein [Rhodopseudomonas julia]MDQ0327604.1 hypothetical protein [Rhodopseudomonas julia]
MVVSGCRFLIVVAAVLTLTGASAIAQPRKDPDWPCIQPEVPTLSVVQVWTGPSVDEAVTAWRDDEAIAVLARRLAARRMPIEDAKAAIRDFSAGLDKSEKEARLTRLFAGIFATLNAERSEVMSGIKHYARRQKAMAEEIRTQQSTLSDLRQKSPDSEKAQELKTGLLVQVRIFNDRRHSLKYVCEVPSLIEQRLFALAREIQAELSD